MMEKQITIEEAIKTIESAPSMEAYAEWNMKRFFDENGKLTDNSIELCKYYNRCLDIVLIFDDKHPALFSTNTPDVKP